MMKIKKISNYMICIKLKPTNGGRSGDYDAKVKSGSE